MNIRNIAIIAHVDHGKTTLVDKMIYACKAIDERKEQKDIIISPEHVSTLANKHFCQQ